MIKQIWTIRSPQRLFSGLAAAVTGVFVLYTIISLFYLPETVPFRLLGEQSRYLLLILPLVMVFACALWFYLIRRNTVLAGVRAAEDTVVLSRQKTLSRDCRTASMMFWAVGLGFWQLDALNTAKQMQGFGLFVPVVCLIAMVVVSARYRLKLRRMCI